MKRILSIAFLTAFFLIVCLLALWTSPSDIIVSEYKTIEEARKDQLFNRGWLPNILPSSTINIETNCNLDLNSSWGEFKISPEDIDEFKSHLYLISHGKYYYYENKSAPGWIFTIDDKSGSVEYSLN